MKLVTETVNLQEATSRPTAGRRSAATRSDKSRQQKQQPKKKKPLRDFASKLTARSSTSSPMTVTTSSASSSTPPGQSCRSILQATDDTQLQNKLDAFRTRLRTKLDVLKKKKRRNSSRKFDIHAIPETPNQESVQQEESCSSLKTNDDDDLVGESADISHEQKNDKNAPNTAHSSPDAEIEEDPTTIPQYNVVGVIEEEEEESSYCSDSSCCSTTCDASAEIQDISDSEKHNLSDPLCSSPPSQHFDEEEADGEDEKSEMVRLTLDERKESNSDDSEYSDSEYDEDDKSDASDDDDDERDASFGSSSHHRAFSSALSRLLGLNPRFLFTSVAKENMMDDMNLDFTELLIEQLEGHQTSFVDAHLCAANCLLEQFFLIVQEIEENCPSSAQAMQEAIFLEMESFLHPRISFLYQDLNIVSAQVAARFVCWMNELQNTLESDKTPTASVHLGEVWKQDCERLIQHYLDKTTRAAMKKDLSGALVVGATKDKSIRVDDGGKLTTTLPTHVSRIVSEQLQDCILPECFHEQVVAACNDEMALLVGDIQLKICAEWRDIPVSQLCATVNDMDRLAQQLEDRNEKYLRSDDLRELGDALVTELAQFAVCATNFLCQRVLQDLCQPGEDGILTSVGERQWETEQDSAAIDQTIATLNVLFANLEQWLISEFYFLKVLKTCFELTIQVYLESFFGNTISGGVENAAAASKELHEDYQHLFMFFNGPAFDKYHNAGGSSFSQHAVSSQLQILQNMAAILAPDNAPELVHEDIVAFLQRFPDGESTGSAAVLHLVGLRKLHSSHESALWVRAIAKAKKELSLRVKRSFEEEDAEHFDDRPAVLEECRSTVRVPDPRNSKFVHNVRPCGRLERVISNASYPHAKSMLRLLETNNTSTSATTAGVKKSLYQQLTGFDFAASTTTTTSAQSKAVIESI